MAGHTTGLTDMKEQTALSGAGGESLGHEVLHCHYTQGDRDSVEPWNNYYNEANSSKKNTQTKGCPSLPQSVDVLDFLGKGECPLFAGKSPGSQGR